MPLKGHRLMNYLKYCGGIRTMNRTATGETPFSMTYGAEAMSFVEVGLSCLRRIHFNKTTNDEVKDVK